MTKQLYVVFFIVVIALLGVLYSISIVGRKNDSRQTSTIQAVQDSQVYTSENVKFGATIPKRWTATEGKGFVNFTTPEGVVVVSRMATNFTNLEDALKESDSKRTITITSQQHVPLGGHGAVLRFEEFQTSATKMMHLKVYYQLVDGWVYSISASEEKAYTNVDRVASTFYTLN